jgi:hypothetical protein
MHRWVCLVISLTTLRPTGAAISSGSQLPSIRDVLTRVPLPASIHDRAGAREAPIAKARQRRLEFDKDKEARGARIDQAVADVYLRLGPLQREAR